jgi:hypothetical protein
VDIVGSLLPRDTALLLEANRVQVRREGGKRIWGGGGGRGGVYCCILCLSARVI